MKLLPYGPRGREKPALSDAEDGCYLRDRCSLAPAT
jgi:hypothetical protein